MNRAVVSIVRCRDVDDPSDVCVWVERSIELIGGLRALVCRGDQVLIKPNLLTARDYKSGATTNPHVVEALIDIVRGCGARKVIIGEGASVGTDTKKAFEATGFDLLAERKKVELVDFKSAEFVPMAISSGVILKRIMLPRQLVESDVIVNVPVMKTHDVFPVTLGLKNMKGVIREKDKKRFHTWGLAQCIVDLNKVVLPQLTVVDGTVGMEGFGPAHGTPVNLGVLISSFDTVAADTVASIVMGVDPTSVEYIRLAHQQGLGCGDISQINVRGLNIEEVKRKFNRLTVGEAEFRAHGIRIVESGACSGCHNVVTAVFSELASKGKISVLQGSTLVFGQDVSLESEVEGRLIRFGSCTRLVCPGRGLYVPGCPPHPDDVKELIEGMDQ